MKSKNFPNEFNNNDQIIERSEEKNRQIYSPDNKNEKNNEVGLSTAKKNPKFLDSENDFKLFISKLQNVLISNELYSEIGLNQHVDLMRKLLIDTYVCKDKQFLHKEEYISDLINQFLESKKKNIMFIFGPAGSGKSTIIQCKYIENLIKWKKYDAIPFYLNLETGISFKEKWISLNNLLNIDMNDYFPQFISSQKGKDIVIFADNFEENTDFEKNFNGIYNNPNYKIIITGRNDNILNNKFFSVKETKKKIFKSYINPINLKKLNTQRLFSDYMASINLEINEFLPYIQYYNDLKQHNLIKTNFELSMLLKLPKFVEKRNNSQINLIEIYENYNKMNIDCELKGIPNSIINILSQYYNLNSYKELIQLCDNFALDLAILIHFKEKNQEFDVNIIDNFQTDNLIFLNKYKYNKEKNITSQPIYLIFKILNLSFEKNSHNLFYFGFSNSALKNYYLTKIFIEETKKKEFKDKISSFGFKKIIKNENLLRLLVSYIRLNKDYLNFMKEILTFSKNQQESIFSNSSTNAITLLVASNISFYNAKLDNLLLKDAILRDGIFINCNFTNSDLSFSDFSNSKLQGSIFDNSIMSNVNFGFCNFNISKNILSIVTNKTNKSNIVEICIGTQCGLIILYETNEYSIIRNKEIGNHKSSVNTVIFAKDKNYILAGSDDNLIKLWSKENATLKITYTGHTKPIIILCNSPILDNFFSGSNDNQIKLWEISTGKLLKSFIGHSDWITSICCSLRRNIMFSSSRDRTLRVWNIDNGHLERKFSHETWINAISLSNDEEKIAMGTSNGKVIIWNWKTDKIHFNLKYHSETVICIQFCKDNLVVSTDRNGFLKIFNLKNNNIVKIDRIDKDFFSSICCNKNENEFLVFAASFKGKIKMIQLKAPNSIKYFEGYNETICFTCFSPDNTMFLTKSLNNNIKLWDISNGFLIREFYNSSDIYSNIVFYSDTLIMGGSLNGTIKYFDFEKDILMKTIDTNQKTITSLNISSDRLLLLSGSIDKSIKLWNIKDNSFMNEFYGHDSQINCFCFMENNKSFVSGSWDKTIKLWDIKNKNIIHEFEGHEGSVNSIDCKENYILSGSSDKTIKLWDSKTYYLIRTFEGHNGAIKSVCFTSKGDSFFSSSNDMSIKEWNINNMEIINNLVKHKGKVNCISVSKNSQNLISCSNDQNIFVWIKKSDEYYLRIILSDKESDLEFENIQINKSIGLSEINKSSLNKCKE